MKDVKKNSSSGIPLVIIVLVLVGVVVGAWYLYNSARSNSNVNKQIANATRTPQVPVNAPPGASPPNMLGSPTASVVVEEFADFQCSSCATAHPIMKEVQSIYGSKIKFVFRNYPLQMHDKAYDAAVAAEAAGMQGKFWAMQDQLFNNQQTWASPSANAKQLWMEYAQKIGLDVDRWQNDIAGLAAKSRVDQDLARGRGLNVNSTPTIMVNNQPVPFSEVNVAGMRKIIDTELQKAPATQAQPAKPAPAQTNSNSSNSK